MEKEDFTYTYSELKEIAIEMYGVDHLKDDVYSVFYHDDGTHFITCLEKVNAIIKSVDPTADLRYDYDEEDLWHAIILAEWEDVQETVKTSEKKLRDRYTK